MLLRFIHRHSHPIPSIIDRVVPVGVNQVVIRYRIAALCALRSGKRNDNSRDVIVRHFTRSGLNQWVANP